MKFKFIDLFAGIGGFHLAMERLGGRCVFASEIDSYARKTYEVNFRKSSPWIFDDGLFNDDIRKIAPLDIPDFDVLCAGFPCQPFSQAGYKRGFYDTHKSERGNLFFNIVEIIDVKRPKAFFLENVRGIINHDEGRTFRVIRDILENELGYSFYFQVVKASDFGLPQLRPRVFMIGFRDDRELRGFQFPQPIPLKLTMSDIWGGVCDRDIGYTLRVGGRGSKIGDRRNWDHYLVNGEVRKLMPEQARKMQGFPDDFVFPAPASQTMKQLGNSVAVDAVRACAEKMLEYMNRLSCEKGDVSSMASQAKNKGEWTELYSFLKILYEKKLVLADRDLTPICRTFQVTKASTLNMQQECFLLEHDVLEVKNKETGESHKVQLNHIINNDILCDLVNAIKRQSGPSFDIPAFYVIASQLGIALVKGGNSQQKSDIVLDVVDGGDYYPNTGFGIKSYLGGRPTLLNASGNTNFIFRVIGLNGQRIDEINAIDGREKLKDRIAAIYHFGGRLEFERVEQTTMAYNLDLVDSSMPKLTAFMLLKFYSSRYNQLEANLAHVFEQYGHEFSTDLDGLRIKLKRLLVAVLLGFFAGSKWDGKYISEGLIVVKQDGEQVAYHITDLNQLEEYLYHHVRFDTPSTTRHRYGALIHENGEMFFKLNLQLRL